MAIGNVMIDTSRPVGSKLDDEMQEEVRALAPGIPPDGTITEEKLHDGAATKDKIAPGAVDKTRIAQGGVGAANYEAKSVGTSALADNAVTADQAGTGVVTAHDTAGNKITLDIVPISTAAYQQLGANVNPNVAYWLY
ncbi:tail fiber protein [Mycobacterium phage LilMcDreamy]|uniref:Uncharacterized protein n=1 Tax=Mycobacterium phage LilMcDreamy TaxID=2652422 RepID=A0A5P8D6K0_9CAUD|nr:tail fiber protein [Mycobacterium phage LilMcDreamy]QFP94657.1 hypothetical protein SEA_LILMCDREAMY_37 [Mycobacterium phage LilMcDreamy]